MGTRLVSAIDDTTVSQRTVSAAGDRADTACRKIRAHFITNLTTRRRSSLLERKCGAT